MVIKDGIRYYTYVTPRSTACLESRGFNLVGISSHANIYIINWNDLTTQVYGWENGFNDMCRRLNIKEWVEYKVPKRSKRMNFKQWAKK